MWVQKYRSIVRNTRMIHPFVISSFLYKGLLKKSKLKMQYYKYNKWTKPPFIYFVYHSYYISLKSIFFYFYPLKFMRWKELNVLECLYTVSVDARAAWRYKFWSYSSVNRVIVIWAYLKKKTWILQFSWQKNCIEHLI